MKTRLTKPEANNKYYIRTPEGYNPCILGNSAYRDADLNVLPNCVGYVCGRWAEIGGYGRCKYNLNRNAKDLYGYAMNIGLKVGKTPKVGALIVWSNSKYGHVAVVEQVISDKEIVVSESGWSAKKAMWCATHKLGNGNWTEGTDAGWMQGYKFVGFVYHPDVEDEEMNKATMKIKYNGKVTNIDDNYMVDGANYVHVTDICQALGKRVEWNNTTKTVEISD